MGGDSLGEPAAVEVPDAPGADPAQASESPPILEPDETPDAYDANQTDGTTAATLSELTGQEPGGVPDTGFDGHADAVSLLVDMQLAGQPPPEDVGGGSYSLLGVEGEGSGGWISSTRS